MEQNGYQFFPRLIHENCLCIEACIPITYDYVLKGDGDDVGDGSRGNGEEKNGYDSSLHRDDKRYGDLLHNQLQLSTQHCTLSPADMQRIGVTWTLNTRGTA